MNDLEIFIPTRDRINFLDESIQSALKNVDKKSVYVVDNSTYNHKEVESLALSYGVNYIAPVGDLNIWQNWNRCFDLAKSKYVAILGDDDTLSPTYVENFAYVLEQYGDLDLYACSLYFINTEGKRICNKFFYWPTGYYNSRQKLVNLSSLYDIGFPSVSAIYRSGANFRFDEFGQDSNDWSGIYKSEVLEKYFINETKDYNYRKHAAAITMKTDLMNSRRRFQAELCKDLSRISSFPYSVLWFLRSVLRSSNRRVCRKINLILTKKC